MLEFVAGFHAPKVLISGVSCRNWISYGCTIWTSGHRPLYCLSSWWCDICEETFCFQLHSMYCFLLLVCL